MYIHTIDFKWRKEGGRNSQSKGALCGVYITMYVGAYILCSQIVIFALKTWALHRCNFFLLPSWLVRSQFSSKNNSKSGLFAKIFFNYFISMYYVYVQTLWVMTVISAYLENCDSRPQSNPRESPQCGWLTSIPPDWRRLKAVSTLAFFWQPTLARILFSYFLQSQYSPYFHREKLLPTHGIYDI